MKSVFRYLFAGSFVCNLLFISPYSYEKIQRDDTSCFTEDVSDSEMMSAVVHKSMNIEGTQMSMGEFRGLPIDIKNLFSEKRNAQIFNNYYTAYNYVGLSYYAKYSRDVQVIDYLTKKANSWIDQNGKLNYELQVVDQSPTGIVYLNLYDITQEIKYRKAADYYFEYLKKKRETSDLIPYNNKENNFSDAVGMYVPFLMEYFEHTRDSVARRIAVANIKQYKEYGIDKTTHIPFHGYNINTGIKLGSCNWGRGIGWYLLALAYCPEESDSILKSNVDKLDYTQFPLTSKKFDSSTALMFEIYKQSISSDRVLNLDFIKTHVRVNGIVTDCSGDTYNLNDYSHVSGNSELCNGFLLILKYKFNNN